MNVDAQNKAAAAIGDIVLTLAPEDQHNLIANIVQGFLLAKKRDLAPALGAMLGFEGVLVVTMDETGLHLDSTAHDDADECVLDAIARLRAAVEMTIGEFGATKVPQEVFEKVEGQG